MKIVSAVLGAAAIAMIYYGAVCFLNQKLSLQLPENGITDKFVLSVGIVTFAVWCYLGSRESAYQSVFETLQNMVILLAMSVFSVTDVKAKLIPNRVVLIFLGIWSVIATGAVFSDFERGLALIGQSIIGGMVGGLIFLLCYLVSRGQLGAGDVKLAFVMGLYLTGQRIVGAIAYGVLVCCACSLVQMARKRLTMKDGVPLAPFLYLGTLITFLII
ncbi:MAG: A24 family peptidase [Lachnospiraceae bacterium]|nr:A24 family peptidase [Lachnospiraceae bacterium]MCM1240855.1 A24 family peptidase [Lachnospiraceae bacterium]